MHRPLGSEEPRHRSRSSPPHHWHSRPLASPRASRTSHRRPPSSTKARGNGNPTTDREGRPTAEIVDRSWNRDHRLHPSPATFRWTVEQLLRRMPAIRRCPVPSDLVELTKQIKAASDIVAVVSSYLSVKPAGAAFKALCPFHNDSRPSLDIDPKRQRVSVAGPAMHMATPLRSSCTWRRSALPRPEPYSPREPESRSTNGPAPPRTTTSTRLLEVMRWAQAKYQHCLLEDAMGEAARKYLGGRKLSGKTVRDFGLGFASLDGDWLVKLRVRRGHRRRCACGSRSDRAQPGRPGLLRPLPRSRDVPDPRCPRPGDRLRRADHARIALCRAGPKVLQLRRDAAVFQERRALRTRHGPASPARPLATSPLSRATRM